MTGRTQQDAGSLRCLWCGYDLRAARRSVDAGEREAGVPTDLRGFGSVVCSECGRENDLRALRSQGWTTRFTIFVLAVVFGPAALLLVTSWLFVQWTDQNLHAALCLLLAPAVIIVHAYSTAQVVAGAVRLRKDRMFLLMIGSIALSVLIDLAACIAVACWWVI